MSAGNFLERWEWVGQRVLEALGNGVWQGLLAAGLIWAGFRLLPRLNAATRYAAAGVALLLAAALPLAHMGLKLLPAKRTQTIADVPEVESDLAAAQMAAFGSVETETEVAEPFEPMAEPPVKTAAEPKAWSAAALRMEWTVAIPAMLTLALMAVWAGVSGCRLAGLVAQCVVLWRMKRRAQAGSAEVTAEFELLRREMHLKRLVRIGLSEQASTPIAAGFFRPMVLLPQALEGLLETPAGRARLEGVLRHELAHLARWDDWTNLGQQVLHAIYFFHPGVCWLSRRMSVEREIACDDHVLAAVTRRGKGGRREYALLLTDFARQMQGPVWAAAPGAWSSENQLKERIHMILNKNRNASPRMAGAKAGMLTVGAVLIALLAMQAGPRLAVADEASPTVSVSADVATEVTPEIAVSLSGDEDPGDLLPPSSGVAIATVRASSGGSGYGTAMVSQNGDVLEVTSGPRQKRVVEKTIIAHPAPEALPVPPVPHVHPMPPHAENPAEPPAPGRPGRSADRDLERRLERLERMVEKLDRKGEWKQGEFKQDFKFEFDEPKFHEKMAKLETELRHKFNPDAMRKIHEEAEKQAEKARREAEKMARDVEKQVREIEKDGQIERDIVIKMRRDGKEQKGRAVEMRRHALEQKRHALEQQMHAIERELERAEAELEQHEDELENQNDNDRNNDNDKNNNDNDNGDRKERGPKKRAPQTEEREGAKP